MPTLSWVSGQYLNAGPGSYSEKTLIVGSTLTGQSKYGSIGSNSVRYHEDVSAEYLLSLELLTTK